MRAALILIAALPWGAAHAHEIHLDARFDGGAVVGRVTDDDGTAVAGVPVDVRLQVPAVATAAHGLTGQDGRFRIPLADLPALQVSAEGEEAHIVEARVSLTDGSAHAGAIAERITHLETTLAWRDILGALGYMLGLVGLAAWIEARHLRRNASP